MLWMKRLEEGKRLWRLAHLIIIRHVCIEKFYFPCGDKYQIDDNLRPIAVHLLVNLSYHIMMLWMLTCFLAWWILIFITFLVQRDPLVYETDHKRKKHCVFRVVYIVLWYSLVWCIHWWSQQGQHMTIIKMWTTKSENKHYNRWTYFPFLFFILPFCHWSPLSLFLCR